MIASEGLVACDLAFLAFKPVGRPRTGLVYRDSVFLVICGLLASSQRLYPRPEFSAIRVRRPDKKNRIRNWEKRLGFPGSGCYDG